MRVVIAPDSFTGSLPAHAVAESLAAGWAAVRPGDDLVVIPVADGGEGTVDVVARATGAVPRTAAVADPLLRLVGAEWLLLADGTAVVEMASASGLLRLTADERDPRVTSTRGTGELIRTALDAGAARVVVGLGGSATNDGGAGCLRSLGARLLDDAGEDLPDGGASLGRLAAVDLAGLDPRLRVIELVAATDVTNPLVGADGASAVFGPQKGASADDVGELDDALARWARLLGAATGVDGDLSSVAGGGAAGGLGAGLLACGAELVPGARLVLDLVGLPAAVEGADLVVTGEGALDRQTLRGKAPHAVAALAAEHGIPCVAVAGSVDAGRRELGALGFASTYALVDLAGSRERSIADAAAWLRVVGERLAREWGR